MAPVSKPRDIIDRKALAQRLDDLAGWSGYTPKTQGEVLGIFKEAYAAGTAEIRRRFETEKRAPGPRATHAHAFLMDQIVRAVHDFADTWVYPSANPTTGEKLTIVATGGYGRGELAPYSDVDLMFLLPYKLTPRTEQLVEFMLYMLWDMGLKVGHATRSVEEVVKLAREDITIRTSLLEARWLWGDQQLFEAFKDAYWKKVADGSGMAFVDQKLAERDGRHDKMGDTRYVLEPNIKEGKGGLRDLQSLIWIAKFLFKVDSMNELVPQGLLTSDDVKTFAKAENFLWTVRCHLHYLAGRPEERLTFNVQEEIAERMGYRDRAGTRGVERFMKHYFLVAKDVGDLTRILCAVLEEQQKKASRFFRLPSLSFGSKRSDGLKLEGGRLNVASDDVFAEDPIKLLGLFREAQDQDLDIHPRALHLVTQNLKLINGKLRKDPKANKAFINMLTGKEPQRVLMWLNEAGVLGRFVPDFGRVVAQMQYDMYHVFTVDEHTIRAVGVLYGIETGRLMDDHPVACNVIKEVQSLRVLYVAVLLHDIAKGRGGDHSIIGAEIALKLCPRFGLNAWETETVSWLVRYHLLMSQTAFKRDLDDPKTAIDFAEAVQSPERLRLLLILTVADIRAVGPNVWNAWKAGLLRELYWQAQARLSGEMPEGKREQRVAQAQARLRARLDGWPEAELDAHMDLATMNYWLSVDTETQVRHAELIKSAASKGLDLHIETGVQAERDATELIVYTADHPGMFSSIAGAIALSGASVVDAKIVTLADGMALDTFWIQDAEGQAIDDEGRLNRLAVRIEDALRGKRDPKRELQKAQKDGLKSRTRVFKVPPRVLIDNSASNRYTVIEINGRDRIGLLYDVTSVLAEEHIQIASAHISTYGERVVDVFYVKDLFGLKVRHPEKLAAIEKALLARIGGAHKEDAVKDSKPRRKKTRAPEEGPPTPDVAAE